ncbi:MAG: RnfABCDGE type electron transport complex subunit D [Planctomycetes bacterium]|jgi:electron transport complex protein RnfD|nr:RnfABCDGE type electron transport complex subunit D [Planctomycetota bacterium]HPY73801.1 RnfABCDGE type electron transport complex subunit D [Planctomycetota bacterium]HQA99497.1 RnfABCDGE type electron transport complex subunit D [Planctomycetota bacterium]
MAENQNTKAEKLYTVTSSPHIHKKINIPIIMWTVVLCLLPAGAMGVYTQGWKALWVILISVATAVITEFICQKIRGVKVTLYDGSAVVTGLLFAYVISCESYWYVVILGSFFSIAVVKHAFGGLGLNIWNPALAGRAFVMASFSLVMTSVWPVVEPASCSINKPNIEKVEMQTTTSATPLRSVKQAVTASRETHDKESLGKTPEETWNNIKKAHAVSYYDLAIGTVNGCIGETSSLLLLLGGLVLIIRGYIRWQLPLTIISTIALCAWIFPVNVGFYNPQTGVQGVDLVWFAGDPLFHVLAGGCILGTFFMATDMVTSPMTLRGQIIFGIGIGVLTMIIRLYGGYPEGMSYAILLMNTAVPVIDRYAKPKVFGARQKC